MSSRAVREKGVKGGRVGREKEEGRGTWIDGRSRVCETRRCKEGREGLKA